MGDVAKGRVGEEICRLDLPITVDAMGIARLLDSQQPDNMNHNSIGTHRRGE